MTEDDDWVEVRRFTDPIGADMMRDFLREAYALAWFMAPRG